MLIISERRTNPILLFTIMVAIFADSTNKVGSGFDISVVHLHTTFYASYIYCGKTFETCESGEQFDKEVS